MSNAEQLITSNIAHWALSVQKRNATGRGSSKKIDLYGINKLRELILELAVRGKLVPQNPEDEPASVLLERIEAERALLAKDKKRKPVKKLPSLTEEEKPYELPVGWQFIRFSEVFELEYGDNLPKSKRSNTGEFPVYGSNGVVGTHSQKSVSAPCIVIGRKGSAGALNLCLDDGCWVTDVAYSSIPPAGIDLRFAFLMFHTLGLDALGKGIKPGLSRNEAYILSVAIPPEAEQHRIVAKVNELMSLCDQLEQQTETSLTAHTTLVENLLATLTTSANAAELEQNWNRIAKHFPTLFPADTRGEESIDQLKQTVLQLAVMGKLVPQNPNDEPASALLEKIAAEKAQLIKEKKIKKQKALPPISEDEKPFELPVGWEWCRIGNASLMTDYGLSTKTSKEAPGVPVLKMGDIQSSQVILGRQQTVPESTEGLPELFVENRDLLYNRTNSAELVGKTGIFFGENNLYSYASYLIRIRTLKNTKLPEFINMNMASPVFRKTQVMPHIKQQCGQANVNGTMMKNMVVAIAPEDELPRILVKVNQLMTLCDQIKTHLQQAQQTRLHLADAMVEEALS